MEDDTSTDAIGTPPRLPEDKAHDNIEAFMRNEHSLKQDQQEQNNCLPPLNINRSYSPQQVIYTRSQSQKGFENLDRSTETHGGSLIEDTLDETNKSKLRRHEITELYQSRSEKHESSRMKGDTGAPRQRELCLPPKPPLEWRLNVLLDKIALNVDEQELKRIKLMFSGPQGIGKKVLEECKTCTTFFTVLKQRGYISRDNLLYLNKILYTLGREDLIKRTVEYCLDEGDVIYYYSDEGQPDTGRGQIKIHVKADVKNYSKGQLEELRNVTASIVCSPAEEIEISAVEPGSSFLITFTMPGMYINILKDLLETEVNLPRLIALDVDIIIIDDKYYDVSGLHAVMKVSQQYIEIMNVYHQLETKRKELEKMEMLHLNCQKELTNARNQLEKVESLENSVALLERKNLELTTKCSLFHTMNIQTNFDTKSSVEDFNIRAEEEFSKRQDIKQILKLVKVNTGIEKRIVHDFELKRDLDHGVKTAEDVLVERYFLFLNELNLTLNLDSAEALKRLSKMLSDEKRTMLINMYSWSKDDLIKACIDADNGLILLGLKCKEATISNKRIRILTILDRFGDVIGLDLQSEYKSILQQMKVEKKLHGERHAYIHDKYEHILAR